MSDRVLAACSLGSGGVLRSFVTNSFPYTDLSKVDEVMTTQGYIAGVKNPAFGHHPEWWDIIIDLENNTMRISPDIPGGYAPDTVSKDSFTEYSIKVENNGSASTSSGDKDKDKAINAFYNKSLSVISNPEDVRFIKDVKHMVEDHFAESSVRSRCKDYVRRFVRIATTFEEHRSGRSVIWPSPADSGINMGIHRIERDQHGNAVGRHVSVPGYGYVWTSEAQKCRTTIHTRQ